MSLELQRVIETKQVPMPDLFDATSRENISNNRKILESVVDTLLLCGRQCFPLRGHRDDSEYQNKVGVNPGNFLELLKFRIRSGDKSLGQHFENAKKNATYKSKTTQNELIDIIGQQIVRTIVDRIKGNGKIYSVLADELQDCSNAEQLTFSLLIAGKEVTFREDFVGFLSFYQAFFVLRDGTLHAVEHTVAHVTHLEKTLLAFFLSTRPSSCLGMAHYTRWSTRSRT